MSDPARQPDPMTVPLVAAPNEPAWTALLRLPTPERSRVHIHLVGIGGSGLSAIAGLLLEQGFAVSGSDQLLNEATRELENRGATIFRGHQGGHVRGADLVLISSAVPPENPEVVAAHAAGIPVVKRSDFLGPLMEGQHGIGVAGTHGKTTTTSMVATILLRAGMDPSLIVGSRIEVGPAEGMASTTLAARAGQGPFVIEADEYDRMFLGLRLEIAVVTNVEWDHVDCYPTPGAFAAAFPAVCGAVAGAGFAGRLRRRRGALAVRDAAAARGRDPHLRPVTDAADWQARSLADQRSRRDRCRGLAERRAGRGAEPGRAGPPQRPQRVGRAGGGALARHPAEAGRGHAERLQGRGPPLRGHRRGGRRDRD